MFTWFSFGPRNIYIAITCIQFTFLGLRAWSSPGRDRHIWLCGGYHGASCRSVSVQRVRHSSVTLLQLRRLTRHDIWCQLGLFCGMYENLRFPFCAFKQNLYATAVIMFYLKLNCSISLAIWEYRFLRMYLRGSEKYQVQLLRNCINLFIH